MENVMMNSMQTQIKIVDFGLSNTYDPSSPLRTHCGSPEYAAPELFVPGKSYGPEVDLWSLGVILFGMVAGQLPFIVAHDEDMASQERRKRLLLQINKGYSAVQRKILSLASSDFRVMISRMLVADPMRRITVNELLFENWITDKGRRAIVTNPYKKMGDEWQIMKQLSSTINISPNSIQHARATEPEGDIAGMYNIVAYKLRDIRLEGDGVSKVIQSQRPIISAERKESPVSLPSRVSSKKRVDRVKSPSVHKIQKMSVEAAISRTTAVKRALPVPEKRPHITVSSPQPPSEPVAQRKIREQKSIFTIDTQNRLYSAKEKHIREQLQYLREQLAYPPSGLPQRVVASASKPRLGSAAPQRPLQHSVAKGSLQQPPAAPIPVGRTASHPITFKNEMKILGTKAVATALLQKKSSTRKSVRTSAKSNPSNLDTSASDRTKIKLERTSSRHSATIPAHRTAHQPKLNRVIPVMKNPSDSKVGTTPTRVQSALPGSQKPDAAKSVLRGIEKSHLAQGDGLRTRSSSITVTTAKSIPLQRTVMNDPIARSIAGYLAKTIPSKPDMQKLKKKRSKVTSAA